MLKNEKLRPYSNDRPGKGNMTIGGVFSEIAYPKFFQTGADVIHLPN
jgi:hypothetical protein